MTDSQKHEPAIRNELNLLLQAAREGVLPPQTFVELESLCKIHPDHVDLHQGLARLHAGCGDLDLARAHAKEAVRLEPENQVLQNDFNVLHARLSGDTPAMSAGPQVFLVGLENSITPGDEVQAEAAPLNESGWHQAITGRLSPQDLAQRITAGKYPEWVQPVMHRTKPGDTVVEFGSGTGELSAILALHGRSVRLVDHSNESIAFSKELFRILNLKGEFVVADITRPVPLASGSADLVWSSGVLEHFTRDEVLFILREKKRISRRAVISLVPNAESFPYKIGKWLLEKSGQWAWGRKTPERSMKHVFEEAGLQGVRESTVGLFYSVNFLRDAGETHVADLLTSYFASLSPAEILESKNGYLLVTTGYVRRPRRLAVVPSDPLSAYEAKGTSSWLEEYYNPAGYFDEVYCLSPLEQAVTWKYGMEVIPTLPDQLAKRLSDLGVDVLRAYGGYDACDFATSVRVPNIPIVVSVHDTNNALLHDSVLRAYHVLAMSNAVRDLLIRRGVASEKISILGNRVNFNVFRPLDNEEERTLFRSAYNAEHIILHVGRKSEQKNLDTVLASLSTLGPSYHLIAVGRGDEEKYRALARQLGVEENVTFLSSVPNEDLPRFYSYCDIMCTPSRWEGFGVVFIEALACGAVVVTSHIAPMTDLIVHEQNGLLVAPYEDPLALAEVIRCGCTDSELRTRIQTNARPSVERFRKERIDEKEVAYYRLIIKDGMTGSQV